jgi:DUF4097 and DUF4098 domain-containing protein YvlB
MTRMKINTGAILIVLLLLFFRIGNYADNKNEIRKTYKNITRVKINIMRSNCEVKKGTGSDVDVVFLSKSDLKFEPQFKQEGGALILGEPLHINKDGDTTWGITVPGNTEIEYSSISGNFWIEGVKSKIAARTISGELKSRDCAGEFDFKSVNGDITVENISGKIYIKSFDSDIKVKNLSGEIQIKTSSGDIKGEKLSGNIMIIAPSGDIKIGESTGAFNIKSASGEIEASGIIIEKLGFFKSASGDVKVTLAQSSQYDLTLDTASGDAELNYNGQPIKGYFELRALTESGDISAPYPFDKEEEKEEWGNTYMIKSFKKGSDTPRITIRTSSGNATLLSK